MWLPHRRHRKPVGAAHGALPVLLLAVLIGVCLSGFAGGARAQEELLSKAGEVDHQIVVREHAGWNQDCDAIDHPALYLHEPPQHGHVCARIENIKIHSMYVGTESQCIGHVVRGVQLIYRPDAGYVGGDALRYLAQYPSVRRAVSVSVTVTAYPPGARPAAQRSIAPPLPQPRQASGPVPACEELLF